MRWSARQFEIVSQPFMDESLPTGAAVTTGTAQIDLATLRAAFATVSSAADSPVTVALLVGSAASSDAVRNAISATLPSTRVATVADDTVVLGGASGAALLALSPRESPLDYPDAAAPVVDDDVQSPSTGRAASIPENGEGFSFSLTRPKPSNRTACRWIPFNRECDVFQLYWSSNSMTSDLVSNEWHFALALNRPGFIRPVYWERPRPVLPERNLPPPELNRLHFSYLPVRIEPPMLAEPSYPGPPVGRTPVTTTGQAPVASAEAGPPAIGGLPPVPPASPGDAPVPRRRRSTRAILAMGTAAAAVLIGGSVLVANLEHERIAP